MQIYIKLYNIAKQTLIKLYNYNENINFGVY